MQTETFYGQLLKMETALSEQNMAQYWLILGQEKIYLNDYIGHHLTLHFKGEIRCLETHKLIKKTYNQGYSYEAFLKLAICDQCIMRPSLCHFAKGTCREPAWGERYCMAPHYVYLAHSSQVKVGITRSTQIPTRWIDQGATSAIIIGQVKDRLTSGLIEEALSEEYSDRTQWQKMLKDESVPVDLMATREKIFRDYAEIFDDYQLEELEGEMTHIQYPILEIPQKIVSLSFDKTPTIKGKLLGIKGQYLIFDSGVLNIRKHQAYFIEATASL
jgi:hypothetical protein